MSINKVILVGHLGQDPELKDAKGTPVATISLATNEEWKDKEGKEHKHTEWHRLVVWGKLAENCAKFLKKGRQVYVEGKNQTRTYEDKDGVKRYTTEVVAHTVQFLGSGGEGGGARPPHPGDAPQGAAGGGDEEVPL